MKAELQKDVEIAVARERIPIHASRDQMDVPGLDRTRFFYRYIRIQNPHNVQRYLDAGYMFVNRAGGQYVGTKDVATTEGMGNMFTKTGKDGVTLGLVAQPIDLYELDQRAKVAENQKLLDTQYRSLQAQADPRNGGFGHIGEHPAIEVNQPGKAQRVRKI